MPTFTMTKTYQDGNVLTESDLDNMKTSTETFMNTTKLDDDNLQDTGISKGKLTSVTQEFFVPTGGQIAYGGATLPSGWLFCDGSAVSRTTFAALFTAIGTAYGVGDGSTTFNVPDKRGRVSVGKDDMDNTVGTGGGDAARMTTGGNRIDGDTLGADGGLETHPLITAELASHSHGAGSLVNAAESAHTHLMFSDTDGSTILSTSSENVATSDLATNVTDYQMTVGTAAAIGKTGGGTSHTHPISGSTAGEGSGTGHDNVQPGEIDNWIVKT